MTVPCATLLAAATSLGLKLVGSDGTRNERWQFVGEGARSALVTRTLVGGESGEQFSWLDWPIGAEESAVMILHFRRGPLQSTVELLWPDARTGEVLDAAERLTAAAVGVL